MQAKKALVLFAVMLALASAAAIGVILPDTYPTPEAISPQQTVPAAAEAPVPLAPQPGHPGGIYTQVVATCYGPLQFSDITATSADVTATGHISPDKLQASVDFAADVRETSTIRIVVNDNRGDVDSVYITVSTQPGVEVSLSAASDDDIKHVSPGVWVGKVGSDSSNDSDSVKDLEVTLTVYGQPISSGDRYIVVTFTAM